VGGDEDVPFRGGVLPLASQTRGANFRVVWCVRLICRRESVEFSSFAPFTEDKFRVFVVGIYWGEGNFRTDCVGVVSPGVESEGCECGGVYWFWTGDSHSIVRNRNLGVTFRGDEIFHGSLFQMLDKLEEFEPGFAG
jgi:hypothetical protein